MQEATCDLRHPQVVSFLLMRGGVWPWGAAWALEVQSERSVGSRERLQNAVTNRKLRAPIMGVKGGQV